MRVVASHDERLTWVGHATVLLELGGARLLTDPLLRGRAGPLRRRGPTPTPDQVADVDAVLISHLHHDHAELTSIRLLPDLPLLTGPRNAEFLRKRKLQGVDLGHLVGGRNRSASSQRPGPAAQQRVGEQAYAVEVEHHGRMAEPRQPHGVPP